MSRSTDRANGSPPPHPYVTVPQSKVPFTVEWYVEGKLVSRAVVEGDSLVVIPDHLGPDRAVFRYADGVVEEVNL